MISKNTLYYYINKYSSIMPDNPPSTDWYNSISANINSYLKYNYGLREVLTMDYIDSDSETDILSWIKEKIRLVFIGNANKYIKLYQIETANTSALSDRQWTKTTTNSGNDETTLSGSDSTEDGGHDTNNLTHGGSDSNALTNGGTDTSSETHGGTDTTVNSKAVFDLAVDVNSGSSATTNGETINTSASYGKTENNTTTYGHTENRTISYGRTSTIDYGKKETLKHGKTVNESYSGTNDDNKALQEYQNYWGKWSFIDIVARDIINEITYSTIF